ncbi:hypothetical protein ABEP16_00770 [Priestia aryabhattai]|uniref:hypothetical protein n=1 Tax=Priestia aryabhattai TaxID=412384 RepID=UPI003D2CE82D
MLSYKNSTTNIKESGTDTVVIPVGATEQFVPYLPLTLIALEGEACVGNVFENDLKAQKLYKPWIASLYIKPQYRSRGVGQTFILEGLKVIKSFI